MLFDLIESPLKFIQKLACGVNLEEDHSVMDRVAKNHEFVPGLDVEFLPRLGWNHHLTPLADRRCPEKAR
jgi:hypothetical protein